ncbi:heparan sulfate 2-O-sulfotransferase pipe-like isoform X2 [Paramacrobiotus metropolitanus]|uniref:heparan sulfate 2-O-sulfotransferase pipe-like isoform X2 n=1 Tax=Paramacrobiotus metropolitanus TaxID=2943436 RepID=UPI002445DD0C|nr:heparan sulfate 2-O-sulfotransferase pipe-like isoform X2 [Paramacrobiotus metropolitanus]
MGDNEMKAPPSRLRRFLYANYYCLRMQGKRLWCYGFILIILSLLSLALLRSGWLQLFDQNPHPQSNMAPGLKVDSGVMRKFVASDLQNRNPRLFYNRVPKCGSSTLNSLLKNLTASNPFIYTSSPLLDDWFLATQDMQKSFVQQFMKLPVKSVFDRHLFFLDFTRFGQPNPIYINMIRDPTDRFISEFYFRRRLQKKGTEQGERKWYDEDLEHCIRKAKDYDCRLVDGMYIKNMIAFFCGQDIECSNHNSKWALETAKENVEKFFTVVGVLEDIDITLRVLQHQLPQYFSGVVELYKASQDHVINKGLNRKQDVSQDVKDVIRKNLTAEYEFYDFIRDRLHFQAQLIR